MAAKYQKSSILPLFLFKIVLHGSFVSGILSLFTLTKRDALIQIGDKNYETVYFGEFPYLKLLIMNILHRWS